MVSADGGEPHANGGSKPDKPAAAPPPLPMNESAAYSDKALSALVAWEAETEGELLLRKPSSCTHTSVCSCLAAPKR